MKGQCLSPMEATKMLENFHERPIGRHFDSNTNVKIWWHALNKDAIDMC